MAVSRCPIDLHFVSLMVPVIAIIHLTVRGKKKGKEGEITNAISLSLSLSRSFSLPCVQQTSHPTVSW